MLSTAIAFILCLTVLCDNRIFLYDTENITGSSEKFHCIYVLDNVIGEQGKNSGVKVTFCRRRTFGDIIELTDKCENGGETKYFVDLLEEDVRPSEILKWNSGVEMADEYAAFYYARYSAIKSKETKHFLCRCTHPGTFGKYCEYRLTHEANSFETSHISQVDRRSSYLFHQLYGDIVCYTTLLCDGNLLCLDWRDICDGEQQCENGTDEENCDKLEFNECEEDEYRCTNGMCIAEEYWLDGDLDCMDWSDEKYNGLIDNQCFLGTYTIDCHERICPTDMWSCGDGQCLYIYERLIFQNVVHVAPDCLNLRHMNYMCELALFRPGWTMPNGLCWFFDERYDDPQLSISNSALSAEEKCVYLIRCALTDGFERDCPCNQLNCSHIMQNVCVIDYIYQYPPGPLIRPYIFTFYNWMSAFKDKMPYKVVLSGFIRCPGYHGYINNVPYESSLLVLDIIGTSSLDSRICSDTLMICDNSSAIKYDSNCWKNSLTFNGHSYAVHVCKKIPHCISQYRINDGKGDCEDSSDEKYFIDNENLCTRVRRHRFRCSIEEPTCFPVLMLQGGKAKCSNNYDLYLYGHTPLNAITCKKSGHANCQLLKEYIQNSTVNSNSNINSYLHINESQYQSTSRITFQKYCDTFWNRRGNIDELLENCQNWVCRKDQYRCQTGQCISLEWVCDGQWDCADASDEEGMLSIHQWSSHNAPLKGLNEKRQKCMQNYSRLPFKEFCDTETEFPCLRSDVVDPLNVTQYHPCIPYSKIGDGIEDCYNAYDEKNTFEDDAGLMWGFAFRCNDTSYSYQLACIPYITICPQILCPYRQYKLTNCSKPTDAVCIEDNRCVPDGRCNDVRDCIYGEDEYWCTPKQSLDQYLYRGTKNMIKYEYTVFDRQAYPPFQDSTETSTILPQSLIFSSKRMTTTLSSSNINYSFWCNGGVAVIRLVNITCFCPPAYVGHKCQYFSDRITIITHLNLFTRPSFLVTNLLLSMTLPTLFKIKVNFLFNGLIIDHYEFHSNPAVEMYNHIKHKFYLLYSRSSQMVLHKRARFYNRTDIENNHPYIVHFDIYALYNNKSTPIALGSWHYPIYFDFLPSFRLATVLRFPYWFGNSSFDPCANHACNENSTCMPILNQNNSYICTCRNGFYGINCSKYEDACNTYCSPYSLCQPNDRSLISNTNNPFCICPFGHFGPRCFLKFEQCNPNPCLNNGSCIYTYESYGGDAFVCGCSKDFYGDRCQHVKIAIHVRLNTSNINESPRASTIQFYDVNNRTLELILQHQQITEGFPSSIYYVHDLIISPILGVLKTHYNSIETRYFIFYLQPNMLSINITSSPERCPLASTLLDKNDLSKVPDVFKYHHICRNNSQLFCFYDNDYLCICEWDHYRVDCFIHNNRIDHCTKCLSNGKCVKGDIDDDKDFLCLCSRCYWGRLCEFNIQAFGFTLDSLLIDCSKELKIFYFSIVLILFFIGLFNNLCSFVTFKRSLPRKVSVGNYLFIITCLNQMSLFCLLVKFIQITFELTNFNSCKVIPYLLSVITRSSYWLISWVTIDRFLVILFPISTTVKKPRLSIGISVLTLFCLFGMHIHEFIYYTTFQHLLTNQSICVTNFDTYLISTYNHISTLIHYLLPFCIQIIAITLLIVMAARSRTKTTGGNRTFRQVLIKQFHTQKELYITPIIIILSALPQTIFTFILECSELIDWHRHTLLIAYLLSYIPQTLGFLLHVLPSTTYKKEFHETLFVKRYFSWLFKKKKSTINVSKK